MQNDTVKPTVGANQNLVIQSHLLGHTSPTALKAEPLQLGLYLVRILSAAGMVLLKKLHFPHCSKHSPDIALGVVFCWLLHKPLMRAQTFMEINDTWALFNYRIFNSSYALLKCQKELQSIHRNPTRYRGISSLVCPCDASVIRTSSLFLELSEEFAKKWGPNWKQCSLLLTAIPCLPLKRCLILETL